MNIKKANDLKVKQYANKWLVEGVWINSGCGILAASPKTGKTWTALDLAVSVATGADFLNHYKVNTQGSVIYLAAEDSETIVKNKLDGIARSKNTTLDDAPLYVVSDTVLQFDNSEHFATIKNTIAQLKPKLVVFDCFVRFFSGNENNTKAIAKVLGDLRQLQRDYDCAIVLVHHIQKSNGKRISGSNIRGSGDFHAWGDVNLFLYKDSKDNILLDIEHRTAESITGVGLELAHDGDNVAMIVKGSEPIKTAEVSVNYYEVEGGGNCEYIEDEQNINIYPQLLAERGYSAQEIKNIVTHPFWSKFVRQ